MDKDRIAGPVKEGTGKVEEAWGRTTGQPETEAEGVEKQAEGKIQERWGEAKDAGRDAIRDATRPRDEDDQA
jgi:uncharacterized protein YjbJ (UPF0337 family)